jgi:glycosyltransferase involved in cell wall biosynthesis
LHDSKKTLAIIPAYNEEGALESIVKEINAVDAAIDILVVNDASKDGTLAIAKGLGVRVADLPINLGIGGAVQTGFKIAQKLGYDSVVQLDGDGQHDPLFIGEVLDPVLSGKADISIGSRYHVNGGSRPVFVRNLGIRFFSWLTSALTSQKIGDCSSGFRALNRRAYEFFAEQYPVDFPDAEALVIASRAGLKIVETPVKFRDRSSGRSSLQLWRMVYYPFKESFSILMLMTKKPARSN